MYILTPLVCVKYIIMINLLLFNLLSIRIATWKNICKQIMFVNLISSYCCCCCCCCCYLDKKFIIIYSFNTSQYPTQFVYLFTCLFTCLLHQLPIQPMTPLNTLSIIYTRGAPNHSCVKLRGFPTEYFTNYR